jgi:hypothetical protein
VPLTNDRPQQPGQKEELSCMRPIHTDEDTRKPENRTNLALLSVLQIEEIRAYLLHRLGLPEGALICPCPKLETEEFCTGDRPDFEIRDLSDRTLGYIEVELGPENNEQICRYRSRTPHRVFSIVGRASYRPSDLSLEDIYHHAHTVEPKYRHKQQEVSLELFCRLVKYHVVDGNFKAANTRASLSDKITQSTLVQMIHSHLGVQKILQAGSSVLPGRIKLDTIGENGFSLRVYSHETGSNGLSLMNRSAGRQVIHFPSLCKLLKYLPHRQEACREYAQLIADLGDQNIHQLNERQQAHLPLDVVEDNFADFAAIIERLW